MKKQSVATKLASLTFREADAKTSGERGYDMAEANMLPKPYRNPKVWAYAGA